MSIASNSLETTVHGFKVPLISMNMRWWEMILYFGDWEKVLDGEIDCHRCNTQHHNFVFSFKGPTVKWIGSKGKDHGHADVYIDEVFQETIDCYSPTTQAEVVKFKKTGLSDDRIHSIRVVVRKERNPEATDCYQDVISMQAVTPVVYAAEIAKAMTLEYKAIQSGNKACLSPDSWSPVKGGAMIPESGVSLKPGVINDAFERNIDYLNHSFSCPAYCDELRCPTGCLLPMMVGCWLEQEIRCAGESGQTCTKSSTP